jgi:hypothetical protein
MLDLNFPFPLVLGVGGSLCVRLGTNGSRLRWICVGSFWIVIFYVFSIFRSFLFGDLLRFRSVCALYGCFRDPLCLLLFVCCLHSGSKNTPLFVT